MVEVFACTTALLSPEFVEGFEPETLASKFIKVEKDYRVKFNKTDSSFNITGHWKAVRDAHLSLLQLMAESEPTRLARQETQVDNQNSNRVSELQNLHPAIPKSIPSNDSEEPNLVNHEDCLVQSGRTLDPIWQVKGNPKRGRHAVSHSQTSQVPEPLVYINYQDQAFASETCVNMDKVLDEFEKGQINSSNTVTKQDLKKILDKNTEQMGRVLHKHLQITPSNSASNHIDTHIALTGKRLSGEIVLESETSTNQSLPETLPKMNYQRISLEHNRMGDVDDAKLGLISLLNVKPSSGYTLSSEADYTSIIPSWPAPSQQVDSPIGDVPRNLDSNTMSHYLSYGSQRIKEVSSFNTGNEPSLKGQNDESQVSNFKYDEEVEGLYNHDTSKQKTGVVTVTSNGMQANDKVLKPSVEGDIPERTAMDMHTSPSPSRASHLENDGDMQVDVQTTTDRYKDVVVTNPGVSEQSTGFPDTGLKYKDVDDETNYAVTQPSKIEPRKIDKGRKDVKCKPMARNVKISKKKVIGPTPGANEMQTYGIKHSEDNLSVSVDETEDAKEKPIPGPQKASERIYKCTDCDYQGRHKKRLTEHMGRVHGLLTEHCRGAQEQTQFPCDLCNKSFVFGKDLNRHKKIVHHGNRYYCKPCDRLYKSKYVYDRHMATHEDGYVQPMFKCQICAKEFTTKFSLGCHIKSEHLGLKKTYMCPTCGKSFRQIRSYRQHANVHAGIRPYVCEICGKSFTYDKSLKEHRFMHDDIRRFPCSICDKAFRQRTCLLIHMKVHKASKDHICSSCGKGFTQKQSLIRHERIHSGHKPYLCRVCGKSFSDYAVIRKHVLMSHKKDRIDWKDFVTSEERSMSSHYIVGGPGYVARETSEVIRGRNKAIVIPPHLSGGKPVVINNNQVKPMTNCQSTINDDNIHVISNPSPTVDVNNEVNDGVGEISVCRSNTGPSGTHDGSLYTNTDDDSRQIENIAEAKPSTQLSSGNSILNQQVDYSTLQNLTSSTLAMLGANAYQGGNADENIMAVLNSQILSPFTGINMSSFEQDPRGLLSLSNSAVLSALTTGMHLGQVPGTNFDQSSVSSHSRPSVTNLSQSSVTNLSQSSVSNHSQSSVTIHSQASVSNHSQASVTNLSQASVLNHSQASVANQSQGYIPPPLGHHSLNTSYVSPESSPVEHVSLSATATAVNALGIPGYQTLFNTAKFDQCQQQE